MQHKVQTRYEPNPAGRNTHPPTLGEIASIIERMGITRPKSTKPFVFKKCNTQMYRNMAISLATKMIEDDKSLAFVEDNLDLMVESDAMTSFDKASVKAELRKVLKDVGYYQ